MCSPFRFSIRSFNISHKINNTKSCTTKSYISHTTFLIKAADFFAPKTKEP